MNIRETDAEYIAGTYNRFPVEIVSGSGSVLTDTRGREYIDMGSGIGVNIFGAADGEWAAAVSAQLGKIQHTSNLYYTEPCVKLAKLLCEKTGMGKVFFSNSGAEANECAVKAARKYAAREKGDACYTIVTIKNSFHGRTLTTLAATGQEHYHELYRPLTPGFVSVNAEKPEELKELAGRIKIAAVLFECIQGEGGVIPLSKDYVKFLREFTEQNGILLMIDEVQTGNGRTGRLYSYMNYGITPDIVTTAKGLGGGLPIGVCMCGEKLKNVMSPSTHGTTFGANPVVCAGANYVLDTVANDKFLAEVEKKGQYFEEKLTKIDGVKSVRRMGLMIGIELEKGDAHDIAIKCVENGLLIITAKDLLRMLPPLVIDYNEIDEAINILEKTIKENN